MPAPTIGEAFVEVHPKSDNFGKELVPGFNTAGIAAGKALVAGLATAKIKDFLVDSFAGAEEAQRIAQQTAAVLRSTGEAAGVTARDIDELTESLMRKQVVDDDQIRQGANLLLTFTNIRNEVGDGLNVFDRATEAAQDMAAAFGQDASSSAVQLGKALNDPLQGLSALSRIGIQFSADQRRVIEALVKTGQTAKAQALILDEVEKQVAGSAAAQATGADRARLAFDELKESIGTGLIPVVETLSDVVTPVLNAFNDLPGPVQTGTVVITGLAAAAVAAASAIDLVEGAFETFAPAIEKVREARAAAVVVETAEAQATIANTAATTASVAAEAARARAVTESAEAVGKTAKATDTAADQLSLFTDLTRQSQAQQELFSAELYATSRAQQVSGQAALLHTQQLQAYAAAGYEAAAAEAAQAAAAEQNVSRTSALLTTYGPAIAAVGALGAAYAFASVTNDEAGASATRWLAALSAFGGPTGIATTGVLGFTGAVGKGTSAQELAAKTLGATDEALREQARELTALGSDQDAFNIRQKTFNSLLEESPAAAARFVDALREAGVNTEAMEAALEEERRATLQAQESTDAWAVSLTTVAERLANTEISTVNASTAAAEFAVSIRDVLRILDGASAATFGVVEAEEAFRSSLVETTEATGRAGSSVQDLTAKQRAYQQAQRGVEDALERVRQAELNRFLVSLGPSADDVLRATFAQARAIREASVSYSNYERAVRAAQRALEEASPQAARDRRTRAELSVSAAQRAVTESAIATRSAEQRLREARSGGEATADEIKSAELDLAAARDQEKLAAIDLRDATRDLNDVGRENIDIQDDATDAINAVTEAQEAGQLASVDAAEAQRALNDLLRSGSEGSRELAEADRQLAEANEGLTLALERVDDAAANLARQVDSVGGAAARTRDRFGEARDAGEQWIRKLIEQKRPLEEIRDAAADVERELRAIGDSVSPERRAQIDPFFREIAEAIRRNELQRLLDELPFLNQAPQPGFRTPGTRHGGGVEGVDPPGSLGQRALRSDEVVRVLQRGEMTLTEGQQAVLGDMLAAALATPVAPQQAQGWSVSVTIMSAANREEAYAGARDGVLAARDVIENRQLAASVRGAVG